MLGFFAIPDLKVGVIATSFRTWVTISSNIYGGFNPSLYNGQLE